jgi:hypothetical protein
MATGITKGTWFICFNIVFVDERYVCREFVSYTIIMCACVSTNYVCIHSWFRFKDSSLKVLGHFEEPIHGEWAILGGTGEFAHAQGVVSFKKILELDNGKTRVRELEIRAICLSFSSSLSPVYTVYFFFCSSCIWMQLCKLI